MVERDVLPALHMRRDRVDRLGVVCAQEFQRLVGEHDAKAPGRVGRVLFEQVDLVLGVAPLPEIGEVEPARPSADHGDPQRLPPYLTVYLLSGARLVCSDGSRQRKYRQAGSSTQTQRLTQTPFTRTV